MNSVHKLSKCLQLIFDPTAMTPFRTECVVMQDYIYIYFLYFLTRGSLLEPTTRADDGETQHERSD